MKLLTTCFAILALVMIVAGPNLASAESPSGNITLNQDAFFSTGLLAAKPQAPRSAASFIDTTRKLAQNCRKSRDFCGVEAGKKNVQPDGSFQIRWALDHSVCCSKKCVMTQYSDTREYGCK